MESLGTGLRIHLKHETKSHSMNSMNTIKDRKTIDNTKNKTLLRVVDTQSNVCVIHDKVN